MGKYVILPDVTCDLNKELRERFDIEYIKGHIILPDGHEEITDCDWTFMGKDEFFSSLKAAPNSFSTSPASTTEIEEAFESYLKQGYDILSLSLSSGLSGTYNFTLKAKESLEKKYPKNKIYCIDTLRYSTGFGLIATYASKLRDEGKSIDEVANWINENKNCFHQMGYLDDLSFVAKKGRISHAKAFMGKLIGIKPLGDIDSKGLTTVLGKVKGDKSAYETIINYIEKTIVNPSEQIIFIAQTNRLKQALELKDLIQAKFNPKEIILNDVYPACATNIGPGLMAAYYMGKPLSTDLSEEKAIMDSIINKK